MKIGQTSIHPRLGLQGSALNDLASAAVKSAVEAEAERAALKRIKAQVGTASLRPQIHWVIPIPGLDITDKTVHRQLEHVGYSQVDPGDTGATEWYEVSAQRAREVVDATVEGLSPVELSDYVLREEQRRFVTGALDAWARGDVRRLWDAKMRFGKTLTAFEFIAEARQRAAEGRSNGRSMGRVLILTHRPVVGGQWFDEFTKVLHGDVWKAQGWSYGSKQTGKGVRDYEKVRDSVPFVYFASMQDLRGRDGDNPTQFKTSNREIFDECWDLVIIDEAHEGNDTKLADEVHDALKRSFTLYLSGTPYKIMSENGFDDTEMDSWDYPAEQEAKERWSQDNPSEPNPYAGLPKLWVLALDMADTLKDKYEEVDDIYFDFNQMFKTVRGKFDREEDVVAFLTKLSDPASAVEAGGTEIVMPFAADQHPHTLWTLPSVESCKAMKALLEQHPFFQDFTVLNVAGDKKGERKDALELVKSAIKKPGSRTITLTVGRLTTGVTVPEWTAVLMLSNMSSAQSYMQTIFRVQSPHEIDGRRKTDCFVYDFDPDRVLQVLTDASGASSRVGTNTSAESQEHLDRFLNFLPVISKVDAHDFRRMDAGDISRAIKRIYRERVIQSGFDSPLLFVRDFSGLESDVREAIEEVRVKVANDLPDVRDRPKNNSVTVSDTGIGQVDTTTLCREQDEVESKPKKERTPEEQADYEARKKELDARENMRRILRTISVRIPLLVLARMSHGQTAIANLQNNFTLAQFVYLFDDESWREFFQEIPKSTVLRLQPAFDHAVLQNAIRGWVDEVVDAFSRREAGDWVGYQDTIATLMGRIRNPNKETVFTPWDTVERVYGAAKLPNRDIEAWQHRPDNAPTFYDINIKSGLFPLYAATNLAIANPARSWADICDHSIYGNARTHAGKWIACTLLGQPHSWTNITVIDVHAELGAEDLKDLDERQKREFLAHFLAAPLRYGKHRLPLTADIANMADRNNARERIAPGEDSLLPDSLVGEVRFDHIISNPPYQISDGGHGASATPVYQHFVNLAKHLKPRQVAMIIPARWFAGGKGLDDFRADMLSDPHLRSLTDHPDARDCFPTVGDDISGGVCYFRWDRDHPGKCAVTTVVNGVPGPTEHRNLSEWDVFVRHRDAVDILRKVQAANEPTLDVNVSRQKPFGLRTNFRGNASQTKAGDSVLLYQNGGTSWVARKQITKNTELIDKYKVLTSRAYGDRGPYPHKILSDSTTRAVGPGSACTETYLVCGAFDTREEAENLAAYLKTRFARFLISLRKNTQDLNGERFSFVPALDMNRTWTDSDLYKRYKLTPDEISFIESMIKEMP